MEGMFGGPVLSRRGVIGMVDSGGRRAIGMDDHLSSYTEAKAPRTILEVLKWYLVIQVQSISQHTNNKYTTLPCDLLCTH
jgi:hypothetical protein